MNILILVLLLLLLLYLGVMFLAGKMRRKWGKGDQKIFEEYWLKIGKMEDSKHAVMEADKLLDQMLKKRGYQGSLGDKLKKARPVFSDNNAIWEAHKLRNKIAHELNYNLKESDYRVAMNGFRKAFRDLGLLK